MRRQSKTTPVTPHESARDLFLPALVLVVITLAAYAPVVNAGFIWDDDGYVTENVHLRSAAGLFDMWFRLGSTTMYVPAVFTTLWAGYQLWGLNPAGYHVINVALHIACVFSSGACFDGSKFAEHGSRPRSSPFTP